MGVIQGLDTIPKEIARDFKQVFKDYLPGWAATGEYNFKPGASTQMAAKQLGLTMQNGSHPWINKAMKDLFNDPVASARWYYGDRCDIPKIDPWTDRCGRTEEP